VATVREAVVAAGAHRKVSVAAGDFEWGDIVIVGQRGGAGRRKQASREAVRVRLAGAGARATRLWGRWAMQADSWGALANVSCVLQVAPRLSRPSRDGDQRRARSSARTPREEPAAARQVSPRGPSAVLSVLGGSVPFPWLFADVEIRAAGGIALLGAQRAFAQLTGSVLLRSLFLSVPLHLGISQSLHICISLSLSLSLSPPPPSPSSSRLLFLPPVPQTYFPPAPLPSRKTAQASTAQAPTPTAPR
jgi:hypothetical protein